MPTYEYKCPKCDTEFEVVQKMTSKPGAKCPKCGSKAQRQMSAGAGLVFKGSGFYLTDYGRSGQKAQKASGEAAASGEKSGTDKSAGADKSGGGDKAGGDKPAEAKPAVTKPAAHKKKDD